MSIFKRLTNLAKGQAKVWSNGKDNANDAVFEAELRATRAADVASDQSKRIKAEGAVRRQAQADGHGHDKARSHESGPIARTDLFGDTITPPVPEPEAVTTVAPPEAIEVVDSDPFATFSDPQETWRDEVVDVEEPTEGKKRSL
jgi:hypothetical protein